MKLAILLGLMAVFLLAGTASATTYTCDSCSACQSAVNGASSSDKVLLNASFDSSGSDCLTVATANLTIDCQWNTINSTDSSYKFIYVNSVDDTTLQNCILNDFGGIIELYYADNTTVRNVIGNSMKTPIYIVCPSEFSTFINNTIEGNSKGNNVILLRPQSREGDRCDNISFYENTFISEDNYIYCLDITTEFLNDTLCVDSWNKTAGNYWNYPNGIGYSQTCDNTNNDAFCDSPYTINSYNTDYLPLTSNFTPTTLNLTFVSPTPANNTIKSSGSFIANISSNGTITSCVITIDGTNYTMDIAFGNLSASRTNSGLSNGKHIYNVTCDGFNSETRTVWVSFGNCTSCSECTDMATNSDTAITINIVNNISSGGSCISGIKDSQTVDGNKNTISCSGQSITILDSDYVTIKNVYMSGCGVSASGYLHHFKFISNNLKNAGSSFVASYPQYPIVEFWNISYNYFNNSNVYVSTDILALVTLYDVIAYNDFLDSELQFNWFGYNNGYPNYGVHHNTFWSSVNGTGTGISGGVAWFRTDVYNNIFMGKQYALVNTQNTYNIRVWNNMFINNTQIVLNSSPSYSNEWYFNFTKDCGKTSIVGGCVGGNYYDTYFGADTNGDGIGETQLPYLYNALGATLPNPDWLPLTNNKPPIPSGGYRLSSVLPAPWGYIAGIVLGAGLILFILATLLGGEIADLLNPKNLALIFVGLVIVAVLIAGIV